MHSRVERVLMTGDTVGGVWTFTLELAEALGRHGIDVVLATMGGEPTASQRANAAAIPNLELHTSHYKLEWMDNPWSDVEESGSWVLDQEKQFAPDVIHLNSYGHGALPWRAPVVLTAHSCVLSWWKAVKRDPVPRKWNLYRRVVERSLRAADLLTTPSHAMLHMIEETYGLDLPARCVVANARSQTPYHAAPKESLILTAGRLWDEAKNIAAVVHVAPRLHWPVYVAGEDRDPGGRSIELNNCCPLGWLSEDDLAEWYARAAIYAAPARYEPFGLSAVEAALSGCALVLGDIASLREVWGDAAVFVPPDDEDHLYAALHGLMEDVPRREALARRGLARARTFTPERMAGQYADAYQRLAAAPEGRVRFVIFTHSLVSDWNHGNAHFLRGVATNLVERGHDVRIFEPRDGWSLTNMLAGHGAGAIAEFARTYPRISSSFYDESALDLSDALQGADVVIVHEWNSHALVKRIGGYRAANPAFRLFFHDTHHRSATDPDSIAAYDLRHYDGVLAYGGVIRDIYRARRFAKKTWTWHEAADTRIFRPRPEVRKAGDLVWIGNWGDDERSEEIREFLIRPVKSLGLKARVYGVRYPQHVLEEMRDAGIAYGGWLPNYRVPEVFAAHRVTLHIPRRPYARALPGIPTIRPFEALACGIPLISAPWEDAENLFRPGIDFLMAGNADEMSSHLKDVLSDPALAGSLANHGLQTIQARHTCAHRVDELIAIAQTAGTLTIAEGVC